MARKEEIAGLAVASDEQIEAYLLYIERGSPGPPSLRIEDGGARLKQLLSRVLGRPALETPTRFPKVHPEEISEGIARNAPVSAAPATTSPLRGHGARPTRPA